MKLSNNNLDILKFLKEIDILIDGKFILTEKSYTCVFRGSTNQRIIDVKKSLESKQVVIASKYQESTGYKSNRLRDEGVFV